jgi:beta-glucosidase/6-phospho-beta-glucosidase/beta-galactosidase
MAGHFLTGFESTYMPYIGTDVLEGTRHNERFKDDFALVKALGITRLRYPASWNYVERTPGVFDWSALDPKMESLQALELTPIIDLVHHTSIPEMVFPDGFANKDFPARLQEFAQRFADRYPWVKQYTVFNEPYITAQLCGEMGVWFPHYKGEKSFIRMMLNVSCAIVQTTQALIAQVPDAQFIHVETCESHTVSHTGNLEAVERAQFLNQRRFIIDDLLLGWVTPEHRLYCYLLEKGVTESELAWFTENQGRIDVRGLDYYRQSEMVWIDGSKGLWAEERRGFAAVAMDYVDRYRVPVMLSETNYFGDGSARLMWLKNMLREYVVLCQRAEDVRGFCWFPFICSTDFQHMLLEKHNHVDPVGLYDLDEARWERVPTELVTMLSEIAQTTSLDELHTLCAD